MENIGIAGIGFVFGYLLYYAVKHIEKFDITLLSAAIGAVGSQTLIQKIVNVPDGMQLYGMGLFIGFLCYFLLSVVLVNIQQPNKSPKIAFLSRTLLGTKVESVREEEPKKRSITGMDPE